MQSKQYESAEIVNEAPPQDGAYRSEADFEKLLNDVRRVLWWRIALVVCIVLLAVVIIVTFLVSLLFYLLPVFVGLIVVVLLTRIITRTLKALRS